uniref:non-specific serine/threonine protein kinase n=1 Tax=Lynx canadensis TaxID=61383 RepID=A0A667IJ65_LYNCA
VKGRARRKLGRRNFMEQARECRDNGYLLSSRKIGSGAFSKVYLACATRERMQHNAKLASDPRGKHHAMVRWIISTAEAPVEFSQKFLPREIPSLNATYRHPNVLYETHQDSRRSSLVLELAARGDLSEHINWASERRCSRGWVRRRPADRCGSSDLKRENILLDDRGLLKLTGFGFASHWGLKSLLPSTFCGSVAYTAPEILVSKKRNGEQADPRSLGITLCATVTGKLPFKEHQTHRMLHLTHHGPTFRPGMSPECRDPIRGLLQLRPCARLGLQHVAQKKTTENTREERDTSYPRSDRPQREEPEWTPSFAGSAGTEDTRSGGCWELSRQQHSSARAQGAWEGQDSGILCQRWPWERSAAGGGPH